MYDEFVFLASIEQLYYDTVGKLLDVNFVVVQEQREKCNYNMLLLFYSQVIHATTFIETH